MPAPAAQAASLINIRHPEGSIRVSAPTDVPLGELLPDLLDLARLPDQPGWAIAPLDGDPTRLSRRWRSSALATARCSSCSSPGRRVGRRGECDETAHDRVAAAYPAGGAWRASAQ